MHRCVIGREFARRVAEGGRRRGHDPERRQRRVPLRVPLAVALACTALHPVARRVVRRCELRVSRQHPRYQLLQLHIAIEITEACKI